MTRPSVALLALVLVLGSVLPRGCQTTTTNGEQSVMVWMCLERCGANLTEIGGDLVQIKNNVDVFNKVSYESYNLGPNSTLVPATDVTNVNPELALIGVPRYPMVSTYPHPPVMVEWMRHLFANPQPFTDQVIEQIVRLRLAGINIDLEPATAADFNADDGVAYAQWLQYFSQQVHAKTDAVVQVCVATWSPLWNLTLIGQTDVDQVLTMSTYSANWDTFQRQLLYAVQTVPISKLGVGIQTNLASAQDLQNRIDLVQKYQISQVAIWSSPVPSDWLPILASFIAN